MTDCQNDVPGIPGVRCGTSGKCGAHGGETPAAAPRPTVTTADRLRVPVAPTPRSNREQWRDLLREVSARRGSVAAAMTADLRDGDVPVVGGLPLRTGDVVYGSTLRQPSPWARRIG